MNSNATDDDALKQFLRWRGVRSPCPKCNGRGCYQYGHGSTWRGGMGTASMAWDVCNVCWGTGDESRTGVDLRKQRDEFNATVALEAGKYLTIGVGGLTVTRPALEAIADELEKLSRGRKRRPRFFYNMAQYLAHKVRDMAKVPT